MNNQPVKKKPTLKIHFVKAENLSINTSHTMYNQISLKEQMIGNFLLISTMLKLSFFQKYFAPMKDQT